MPEFPGQTHAFFWREILAMRAQGHELTLLSTRRPPRAACPHDFAEQAHRETIYLYPPHGRDALALLARVGRSPAVLAYLRELSGTRRERLRSAGLVLCAAGLVRIAEHRGLGHVHVHSCANSAHIAALARRLGGPSFSLSLHGDLSVYGRDHRAKTRDAEFVAAVTRPLREQLLELGLPPERLPIVPMGVDTERFCPGQAAADSREGFQLVTVARLHPNKGHVHALRALARGRDEGLDIHYRVAGTGPHREVLQGQIRELGLEGCVELLGGLGQSEVLALLQGADALVLPSVGLGEAAPVSLMEAMAVGLPAICSRIGGTPDMIDDGVDGILVEQGDEDGLLRALRRLVGEPELGSRLGAAARARALADFDYRRQAARLLEAIQKGAASG